MLLYMAIENQYKRNLLIFIQHVECGHRGHPSCRLPGTTRHSFALDPLSFLAKRSSCRLAILQFQIYF